MQFAIPFANGIQGEKKTVAVPMNCLDVPGVSRRVSQCRAKFGHGLVQAAIKINEGVLRPERLANLLTSHQFSRTLQEEGQQLERLLLQFDFDSELTKLGGAQVYFKDTEAPGPDRISAERHNSPPQPTAFAEG
jgi:hypothetical protein